MHRLAVRYTAANVNREVRGVRGRMILACGSRIPPTRGIQVPFGKARLSFSDHSRPLSSRVDLDCS